MCGIAGIITFDHEVCLDHLESLGHSLLHRGPDDVGFLGWSAGRTSQRTRRAKDLQPSTLGLVHRRLSIIDLSADGWQPMHSPDGRYSIVYNGEVYNFLELRRELEELGAHFTSRSDTEVVLTAYAMWGVAAFARFNGMFALAILDEHEETVVLARDCFGIKPLYYTRTPDAWVFASELRSLMQLPFVSRRVDPNWLYDYLRFGRTDVDEGTLLAEIKQVPAASHLSLHVRTGEQGPIERYWQLDLDQELKLSFEDAAEELRHLFLDSVDVHLRSDVQVGAALSGGIDSTALVSAVRELRGAEYEIPTFSYVAEDHDLSEEFWIDLVSKRIDTRSHKTRPVAADLVKRLDSVIAFQGEPFASTSIFAQHEVFRLAQASGIKVTLDGQGADEILGGYPTFGAARCASLIRQGRWAQAFSLFKHLAGRGVGARGCLYRLGGLLAPASLQGVARDLVGEAWFPSWMRQEWFVEHGVSAPVARQTDPKLLRWQLHQALTTTSLPALLRYGDRNSMICSIESRVPFLTPGLVQFVFSLPERYLINQQGTSKAVFREAMRGIAPNRVLERTDKVGFVTPQKLWFGELSSWVDETLSRSEGPLSPVLNGPRIAAIWNGMKSGDDGMPAELWRWLNLSRWSEQVDAQLI